MKRRLKLEKPSIVKLEMLGAAPEDVLKSGNLCDAPSSLLLQKISSENHSENDSDKDFVTHLQKLSEC